MYRTMNLNRIIALSKTAKLGKTFLCGRAGKELSFGFNVSQRGVQTSSRSLVYGKDLFLGKVNKVGEKIHVHNTQGFISALLGH